MPYEYAGISLVVIKASSYVVMIEGILLYDGDLQVTLTVYCIARAVCIALVTAGCDLNSYMHR